jgi:hypothetical protein
MGAYNVSAVCSFVAFSRGFSIKFAVSMWCSRRVDVLLLIAGAICVVAEKLCGRRR